MKEVLSQLFEHKHLSREEAKNILLKICKGEINASQISSFITVFLMRSIKVDELAGFRDAMLEVSHYVDLTEFDPIDVCGTGGDGKNTFNISTISAFVAAGAGVKIAKHGNYAVSSASGSSNVLEAAGVKFTNDMDKLKTSLDKSNVAILHAPLFHPAMKNVAPIRKELGVKTFFNILGPTINPSRPTKQLSGVYNLELTRLYGHLFYDTFKRFAIIHSIDGYDEISLTSDFKLTTHENKSIISPQKLGFAKLKNEDLHGGNSISESLTIFNEIINNKGTLAQNQVVIANAAMAIWVANEGTTIKECISKAEESLLSGNAKKCFTTFLSINH